MWKIRSPESSLHYRAAGDNGTMSKKQRGGRPGLSPNGAAGEHTPVMNLRVPVAEQAAWKSAAATKGLSLSAWVRQVMGRAARRALRGKE
jgi:hypothetical protein